MMAKYLRIIGALCVVALLGLLISCSQGDTITYVDSSTIVYNECCDCDEEEVELVSETSCTKDVQYEIYHMYVEEVEEEVVEEESVPEDFMVMMEETPCDTQFIIEDHYTSVTETVKTLEVSSVSVTGCVDGQYGDYGTAYVVSH